MSNIDAKAELDKLLAAKPFVTVTVMKRVKSTRLVWPPHDHSGEPIEVTYYVDEAISTAVPANLVNTKIIAVSGLTFGQLRASALPENMRATRKTIKNVADATVSSTISLSVAATESWSVTKTVGLTTTQSGTISLSFGIPAIGSAGASMTVSQTISTSTADTEGGQRQVSRTTNDTVSIGPHKSVQIELLAFESPAEIPFSATVTVDGEIVANNSGISLASQLLSASERTFNVEGSLSVVAVSEGLLTVSELPQSKNEKFLRDDVVAVEMSYATCGKVGATYRSKFLTQSALYRGESSQILLRPERKPMANNLNDEGPSIGPPDGTSYEILFTTQEFRSTPACGFNDVGAMNLGVFEVESRRYSTHSNGELVASWEERVERFVSCWSV